MKSDVVDKYLGKCLVELLSQSRSNVSLTLGDASTSTSQNTIEGNGI